MPYNGKATGAIFQNGRKQKDSHPDYQGEIEIGPEAMQSLIAQRDRGEEFPKVEIAGWKKTTKNGDMFLSVNANPPYEGERKGSNAPSGGGQSFSPAPTPDDKIPF
jgi:hypothetical protein